MNSTKKQARVAGLLYLLASIIGLFGLIYPSTLIAGSGYLASSFTSLLLPSYRQLVDQFTMVLTAGELPIIFWLLIWGAKDQPLAEQSVLPSGS